MTAKKDLKRRVRERQERTGESYTTARARVIAQAEPSDAGQPDVEPAEPAAAPPKEPPFSVVELVDATEDAARLGMKCTVLVSPSLAKQIPPARVLERIRDALIATGEDPQTRHFRDVMLRGERAALRGSREDWTARWEVTRQFLTRVKAGIGGVHPSGDIMALQVDDQLVLVQLGHVPHMPPIPRPQLRVFLTTVDASLADSPLPLRR